MTGKVLRLLDGSCDIACNRNMIVFDQNRIVQPQAMVAPTAAAYSVFLYCP